MAGARKDLSVKRWGLQIYVTFARWQGANLAVMAVSIMGLFWNI